MFFFCSQDPKKRQATNLTGETLALSRKANSTRKTLQNKTCNLDAQHTLFLDVLT
jgi:hypothetical protein